MTPPDPALPAAARHARVITRVTGLAVALGLVIVLLQAVGAGDALEYRRAALPAAPWRALTAHLVHLSWPHALVNAAALVIVARLVALDLGPRRQALALLVGALAVVVALYALLPVIAWYRGLSGALHALFFAGTTLWWLRAPRRWRAQWLPALLVVGGWIKVLAEQSAATPAPQAAWLDAAVVPGAHLAGALAGSALALVWFAQERRRR